jgi:hypothetical protein
MSISFYAGKSALIIAAAPKAWPWHCGHSQAAGLRGVLFDYPLTFKGKKVPFITKFSP